MYRLGNSIIYLTDILKEELKRRIEMSFSSTSKRWESASIDDVAREINRIMGDQNIDPTAKSLHITQNTRVNFSVIWEWL